MEGIIKRVDELGRIVIPKEIRKQLKIKTGTNLEIQVNEENLILKKYSPIAKIKEISQVFAENLNKALKHNIVITDLTDIIAVYGKNKKELIDKSISENLEMSILRRENILEMHKKKLILTKEFELTCQYIINTIISNGDPIGLLIIYDNDKQVDEIDYKISEVVANFIGKYIEE